MDGTLPTIPLELQSQLEQCKTLPSPPKLALQIIELIKDPDLTIERVVETFSKDPALLAKILRLANSAHYAYQHKVNNIEKAIMIIGLNGILSLALSFSLTKSLKAHQGEGLNYSWYWLRALIAGSACRSLAEVCRRRDQEELFTAALIQDVGMLVIDQIEPGFYASLDILQTRHHQINALEQEKFGTSHAIVGSWLLLQWNFPKTLALAPYFSDESIPDSSINEDNLFFRFISLAGSIADLYLLGPSDEELLSLADRVESELGKGSIALPAILKMIEELVGENAPIFDIEGTEMLLADSIYEQARELLVRRALQTPQPVEVLSSDIISL